MMPPWNHKPPAVGEVTTFWTEPPPSPSPRCLYWIRRYRERSWTPNKWYHRNGYYTGSQWLGVYIWEHNHVISPMLRGEGIPLTYLENPK